MSRVQSFMSTVAWHKSECCHVLHVVFEKCGKDDKWQVFNHV